MVVTKETSAAFAHKWTTAWNSRKIEDIMDHYSSDVVFKSPRIVARHAAGAGVGDATGVIHGSDNLRVYFQEALDKLQVLQLTVLDVLLGVGNTFAVHYVRETGAKVVEVFSLDEAGKAKEVQVFYDSVC